MIECNFFYDVLTKNKINFFTGVPDSLLKNICSYITDNTEKNNHVISSNEGASVGLAIGYNLATSKIPLVYMQNSGLGNIINPLLSLADKEVYSNPMILMIGWRGEPGVKDEPQHIKQGAVTLELLESMKINYEILPSNHSDAEKCLDRLVSTSKKTSSPCALIVRKNTFADYNLKSIVQTNFELNRESAIEAVLSNLSSNDVVVSTTGKTSREVFEFRVNNNLSNDSDFLTVGGMGHCNQIALGIAMQKQSKNIYCLDGDGAALMHLGSLGLIGDISPSNFFHIVINNGAHDSVGGQPTIGHNIDFSEIARNFNYKSTFKVKTHNEITELIKSSKKTDGPVLIEILTNKGSRSNLGRPTIKPIDNKSNFMKFLNK
jgi:phosphonopyruvate decarboxylase